jgi:phospholipase C
VPAVLVSPYARPNCVLSDVFDHTSVLKLIEEKWNLPPLTRRDAAAESPLDAVDLDDEPAFAKHPKLPEPALRRGSWSQPPQRRTRGPRRRRAVAANR